jgi:hypothetical protein
MLLFNVREAGEALKTGFNFYPLKSQSSVGFVFHCPRCTFRFRYSKVVKRLFVGRKHYPKQKK